MDALMAQAADRALRTCESCGRQLAQESALKNSQDVDLSNKMSEFPGLDLQLYLVRPEKLARC